METDGGEDDYSAGQGTVRHACDRCRARKIGCNRGTPCSNCQTISLSCTYSGTGAKRKEAKRRVLLSSQYEKKIDDIAQSLKRIEQAYQDPRPTPSSMPAGRDSCSAIFPSPSPASATTSSSDPGHVPYSIFEGGSSLTAHSVYAKEYLQRVAGFSSSREVGRELADALDALRHAIDQRDHRLSEVSLARVEAQISWDVGGLPPVQIAVSVLRWAKENPTGSALWLSDLLPMDQFYSICQKVYFPLNACSEAEFILANGYLYWLCMDFSIAAENEDLRAEYRRHGLQCRANLERALSQTRLVSVPTMEVIAALVVGAYLYAELSKPTIAWLFTSTASQLCQTLGYHRVSTMDVNDPASKDSKIRLFWSVYIMDKILSLRLGRASTLQDYDISLPEVLSDTRWIRTARIQGKVYEQLYSPPALKQPDEERANHARHLAAEIQNLLGENNAVDESAACEGSRPKSSPFDLYLKADEVLRLSVLTLIYRAIPVPADSPTHFSSDCIAAARAALEGHQACTEMLHADDSFALSVYINFTILQSPFVSFIVILCHAIEKRDEVELARLHRFIASLQSACSVSESVAELHHIFQLLYNAARLCIRRKATMPPLPEEQVVFDGSAAVSSIVQQPGSSIGHDVVESSTAVLEDVHQPEAALEVGDDDVGVDPQDHANVGRLIQGLELPSWYYDNQYVMDLLEDAPPS